MAQAPPQPTNVVVGNPQEEPSERGLEYWIPVGLTFEGDLYVEVDLLVLLAPGVERNVIEEIVVWSESAWTTLITGELLRTLPALARDAASDYCRNHPSPQGEAIISALGSNKITSVPRFPDSHYLPFAIVVDEVMRRPAEAFPGKPQGVFGRLGGTKFEGEKRPVINAWVEQCRARDLLDGNRLTEKARKLQKPPT